MKKTKDLKNPMNKEVGISVKEFNRNGVCKIKFNQPLVVPDFEPESVDTKGKR